MAILGLMSYDAVDVSRFAEEFDLYNVPTYIPTIVTGRYGGQALAIRQIFGSNYYAAGFLNSSNSSTIIQGTDLLFTGTGLISTSLFVLMDGPTTTAGLAPGAGPAIQILAYINSNGSISFYRGSTLNIPISGTLLGTTATGIIQLGRQQHIEWKVFVDGSSGTIKCVVDGNTVINLSGLNTKPGSNNYPTSVIFTSYNGSGSVNQIFDNSYVLDGTGSTYNDLIGPQGMDVHLPNNAGSNTNWTPLSAPNWSQVNDYANASILTASPVPDDSSTYISSGPVLSNVNDTYPVNLFGQKSQNAIQFTFRASSTVSSGNRVIQAAIYDGSTLFNGPNIVLNESDTAWHSFRDVSFANEDPSTSTAWNTSLLNAREYGVTNLGNSSGGGDTAVVEISQIKITRMYPAFTPLVPNHPLWITG